MAKLTLSVDKAIVKEAKKIAAANGTSVSVMFSQFVEALATPRRRRPKIGPLTRKVSGLVKLPPDKDYKELVTEALRDKYGVRR